MVEIFKTNVKNKRLAGRLLKALKTRLPEFAFNFDLEDCDRILRVKGNDIKKEVSAIMRIFEEQQAGISLFEE